MLPTDFRIASAVDTLCISIPHVWVGVVCSTSLRLTQSAIYYAIETKDFYKSIKHNRYSYPAAYYHAVGGQDHF